MLVFNFTEFKNREDPVTETKFTAMPADTCYTADHEWVASDGDLYRVGITDYAQGQLGDIVFIELPDVGSALEAGEEFGSIESVKAVSQLMLPISGEIAEVNEDLADEPERVNQDPYANWIVKISATNPEEISGLMNAEQYESLEKSA